MFPALEKEFDPKANSLGFLRFFFAAVVVVGHAFPLGGFNGNRDPMDVWTSRQETLGGIAVGGFFVLSGFLITRSFASAPSPANYAWRRCLRILPGLWVCLLFTAFVAAPLVWWHDQGTLAGFLGAGPNSAFDYVRRNALVSVNQWGIAGLLEQTPYRVAFNGSLWTLFYEIKCYIGLGVLGAVGLLRRGRVVILALFLALWVVQIGGVISPGLPEDIWTGFRDPQMVRLPLFFLFGTVAFLYRERMIMSAHLAAVSAVIVVAGFWAGVHQAVGPIAIGYICLWLTVRVPIRRFDAHGDFSYGLYIYAFPVQQVLTVYGMNRGGLVPYILLTMVVTTALAVASWYLVERPCLKYKDPSLLWRRGSGSDKRNVEELHSHASEQVQSEPSPLRESETANLTSEAELRGVPQLQRGGHE